MTKDLHDLLEAAKKVVLTLEENEQQRPIRLLPFGQSLRAGSSTPSLWSVPLDCARGFGKTGQALTPLRLRQRSD